MQEYFMRFVKDQAQADPVVRAWLQHGACESEALANDTARIKESLKPFLPIQLPIEDAEKMKAGQLQIVNVSTPERDLTAMPSFRRAQEIKQETIWHGMSGVLLVGEIQTWLDGIQNPRTKRSYYISMNELIKHGFIDRAWSVQQYSLISPDLISDKIKVSYTTWSPRTREARIACFLAFTRYLSRKTEGVVRRGIPCRDGISKTFSTKTKKVSTNSLTRKQLGEFLRELDLINVRDGMIARLCIHGGKRISEVLSLTVEQINFENFQIRFSQSKSKFADDYTIISYEYNSAKTVLESLKAYIGERRGFVFVTASGKSVKKNQVDRNFIKAGGRAGIPFNTSPHVLRATFVTLAKIDGFSDCDIMRATGHSSSEMVNKYDKRDLADNATKKLSLF